MKDILIVVKPRQNSSQEPYSTFRKEALEHKESVREVLGTAFLITGPKSFQIAMSLSHIAFAKGLQLAFFEIESCLLDPTKA